MSDRGQRKARDAFGRRLDTNYDAAGRRVRMFDKRKGKFGNVLNMIQEHQLDFGLGILDFGFAVDATNRSQTCREATDPLDWETKNLICANRS